MFREIFSTLILVNHAVRIINVPFKHPPNAFYSKVSKLVWSEVVYHGNPKYLNLSLVSFNGTNGDSLLNFTLQKNVSILKFNGAFSFSLPTFENDKNYDHQIVKSTVNMCKLVEGVRGNFITKMLMENFAESADFSLKCPIDQANVSLKNFKITDSSIPTYLLISDIKFEIVLRVHAKISNSSSFVYFLTVKLYGEVRRG